MTTQATEQEQDLRLKMLNSFLSCPHRDTEQLKGIHGELDLADPLFYAHLAGWYLKNGEIRDHKEVFAGTLITDSYTDNREVGLALFRILPTFMKRRIVGFIKGKTIKLRTKTGKQIKKGKKMVDEVTIEKKSVGLFKNIPTSFKKDVEAFLTHIEGDNDLFDAIALRSSEDLKGLYASLRIKPSERAQSILFKKKYPEDSKLNVFQQIADAKSPAKVAKLIVEHKIPYTVAVGLVDKVTPSILIALINAMSPQEVINNISSLSEKGAMNNADTKVLIEEKLEKAKTAKNVSALKSKAAKKTGRIKDEQVALKLDQIADEQIKRKGTIKVPTAVFIDKSGSMSKAIEVGKNVSALVSGATEATLDVVAFDTMAHRIQAEGNAMSDWEKAFVPVRSHGGTSIGVALDSLIRRKVYVDQIVVITDEGENNGPYFHEVFPNYVKAMGVVPSITIIRMPTNWGNRQRDFSNYLKSAKIDFDYYTPPGDDYYGLPGLIQLLSKKSKLDLLYEIMDTPLLKREPFKGSKKKNNGHS
jgi:hypothetical protein